MIRFCPRPYEGEILYSVVARCGVYLGLRHAALTRALFGRTVSPSIEPASYLQALSDKLNDPTLEQKHTLRPLCIPFHTGRKRLRNQRLRYCPLCVKEQIETYGEAFWQTACQIKEVKICPKHRIRLRCSSIPAGVCGSSRRFEDLTVYLAENASEDRQEESDLHDRLLAAEASAVLDCAERLEPTVAQWKSFYQELIPWLCDDAHGEFASPIIYSAVEDFWTRDWLRQHGLLTITRSNCCHYEDERWLYHLVLIKAFKPEMTLLEGIRKASKTDNLHLT